MDKFAPTKESWIDLQNTVYPAIRFGSVSIAAICAAFTGVMFGYPVSLFVNILLVCTLNPMDGLGHGLEGD